MSPRSYYFMATPSPKGLVTFCISLVEGEKRRPRHSLKALVQKWYTSLLFTLHWLELSHMVASNSKRSWKIIFQLQFQEEENKYFGAQSLQQYAWIVSRKIKEIKTKVLQGYFRELGYLESGVRLFHCKHFYIILIFYSDCIEDKEKSETKDQSSSSKVDSQQFQNRVQRKQK